jgi:hypothetical protein
MGTTLPEIRAQGWKALIKELGYSGATKFILLYEPGEGNYTKERKELFKSIKIEEIVEKMKKSK